MTNQPPAPPPPDEEPLALDYANPRLCRRYQRGALWKSVCRVVGGVMAVTFLSGYAMSLFAAPDIWLMIVGICAGAALVMLILWERGMVLREPIWEGSKDLRATTWRASASRFDSSGVTVVDPHSQGRSEAP